MAMMGRGERARKYTGWWIAAILSAVLANCGDPNVPLTRPPSGAFRSTPLSVSPGSSTDISTAALPSRPGATPLSAAIFDRSEASRLSLAALTASILDVPWALTPQPKSLSALALAADYWDVPWPPRLASPSSEQTDGTEGQESSTSSSNADETVTPTPSGEAANASQADPSEEIPNPPPPLSNETDSEVTDSSSGVDDSSKDIPVLPTLPPESTESEELVVPTPILDNTP
ncbi:MAG: hypothetical protein AAGB13_13605 [Cyanobacteria bacterium P01_F01_bin.33]